MKNLLKKIWKEKTAAEKARCAVIKGDVTTIETYLAQGGDPVPLYMDIKTSGKGHRRAIDFLENYIEDIATIPGGHVPRNHDWRIDRKNRKPK